MRPRSNLHLLVLIALLGIAIIYLLMQALALADDVKRLYSDLEESKSQADSLKKSVNELEARLASAESQTALFQNRAALLNSSYILAQRENAALEMQLKELGRDYSSLRNETLSLLSDIERYQQEISSSLEWYDHNSRLGSSSMERRAKREIESRCVDKADSCRIRLGCFYLVNSEMLGLSYRQDDSTFGKDDRLASIGEFLENEGGDCEDYSLFFKAMYNHALSVCEEGEVQLEAWTASQDGRVWLDFAEKWYLEDARSVQISGHDYPNIICGNLYDLNAGEISGHCMIAFTSEPILSVDDIVNLDGAYIIEPQDGSYQGRVNEEVHLLDEDVFYDDSKKSWIYSVITDRDFYLFSESQMGWQSYQSFYEMLEARTGIIG